MGRPRWEWQDEYTLLCERCGYVIEGLPWAGSCPECGKPVAESLPERRVGTPWQRRRSFVSLIQTWTLALVRPRTLLDRMRFDVPAPGMDGGHGHGWLAALSGVLVPPAIVVVFVLNAIEAGGLCQIARVRGGRISYAMAWAIVCHGSVGWLISTLGIIGFVTCVLLSAVFGIEYVLYGLEHPRGQEGLARLMVLLTIPLGVLPFFGGFLIFEVFAYLGFRRCRFANRIRPGGVQTSGLTSEPAPKLAEKPAPEPAPNPRPRPKAGRLGALRSTHGIHPPHAPPVQADHPRR